MNKKQTNKPFAVEGVFLTTPKGKSLWCQPKVPARTYNPEGVLSTSLVCNPDDPAVQKFIETLEELRDTAYNETIETLGAVKAKNIKKRDVYTLEEDADGNETGNVVFKFKLSCIDKRRDEGRRYTIDVVDTKKKQIPTDSLPLIGNGSTIRCNAFVNPYYMGTTKEVGLSFIWMKMQLIDLEEYSGGNGDDFEDEEGFEAPTTSNEDDDF